MQGVFSEASSPFAAKHIDLSGPLEDLKFCTGMCIKEHVYLYR